MVNYETKDVPNVKISLMENNNIVYTVLLDTLSSYEKTFSTTRGHIIKLTSVLINPQDLAVLLSKKYDKYIIEAIRTWKNSKTFEDELIEDPAVPCTGFQVTYLSTFSKDEATEFNMTFWEKRNEY